MTFILIQVMIFLAVYLLLRPIGRRVGAHQRSRRPLPIRGYGTEADAQPRREVASHQSGMRRALADRQAGTTRG
ncbi:MAG: hypothetical protein KTV45_13180 [Acidimicrobiia bacterium]|nr:hypothetical protein [Acidimicrobiia bacterium]